MFWLFKGLENLIVVVVVSVYSMQYFLIDLELNGFRTMVLLRDVIVFEEKFYLLQINT